MDEHRTPRSSTQLAALGLPAFGIALAYTIATTYLPVLIERLSGPAITGFLIGGEGLLSLVVPVIVGSWSDATRTRLGARMPFVLAGAAFAVAGLLVIPSTTRSLLGMGVGLGVFFLGYFVYHSPTTRCSRTWSRTPSAAGRRACRAGSARWGCWLRWRSAGC